MNNTLLLCLIFAAVIPYGGHAVKILSMQVGSTDGYTMSGVDTTIKLGISFKINMYAKGKDCFKIVNIEQLSPKRSVDKIKISCEPSNWSVTKSMIHFGNIVHIQTKEMKVFWAVFDLGGNCIQKTYRDQGEPQLAKYVLNLNRGECDQVVSTQISKRKPKSSAVAASETSETNIQPASQTIGGDNQGLAPGSEYTAEEEIDLVGGGAQPEDMSYDTAPSPKEYDLLNKQKVVVLNGNVKGFKMQGPPNIVYGRGFDFTVERYVKPGTRECVMLVTISKQGDVLDKVKMSCEYTEPDKLRGFDLHISSIIFEDPPFEVKYVIEGGVCVKREYFGGEIKQKTLSEGACYKLTKRTKQQRTSGVIPGTEPMTPEDIKAMDNQIVAVLDGSLKDFKPKGSKSAFSTRTGLYQVEVQEFIKGSQCVKLVSFKRNDHDQYFDQVKISCKIKGPVVTNDEDIEMNFGNVIYLEDRFDAVFVMKNGECLQRDYFVFRNDVEKTDKKLNLVNCFVYTRWKLAQRKTAVKLNKPAPPKTVQAPGFSWFLELNGDTNGYTKSSMQNNMNGNSIDYYSQDYIKADEECIRLVVIKVYNNIVDTFKISCGPSKGLTINGSYLRYGKAFKFQPDKEKNKFKALFNKRDGTCVQRTYTVNKGSPIKKTLDPKVKNQECKDLREGKDGGSMNFNGGSISFGNNVITNGGSIVGNGNIDVHGNIGKNGDLNINGGIIQGFENIDVNGDIGTDGDLNINGGIVQGFGNKYVSPNIQSGGLFGGPFGWKK